MTSMLRPYGWLNQTETAAKYGVHVCTLMRARERGELRAFKRGKIVRYAEADVLAWIASFSTGGDR